MANILLIPLEWSKIRESNEIIKIASKIFVYPNIDLELTRKRIEELHSIGVNGIILEGETKLWKYYVLGKGTNSIVVKGIYKNKVVALKILRLDASRNTLKTEADILNKLKNKKVAPKLLKYGEWYLIEDFVEGDTIFKFLNLTFYNLGIEDIHIFMKNILEKAFILDKLKIDHGELSKADKHIIVKENLDCRIIDFESASLNRKPKNLTAITQYLLIRSPASVYLRKLLKIRDTEKIFDILSLYKKNPNKKNYLKIIEVMFRETQGY